MFALVNGNQLILGPIEFNYRLINSALEEDLELDYRIAPSDYLNVPILITQDIKLLKAEKQIPSFNNNAEEIFLSNYIIVDDKVIFEYEKRNKDFEVVKNYYKNIISSERWKRENLGKIEITINEINLNVSTDRETRISLVTKLTSGEGPYNFKFGSNWVEITSQDIKNIISKIDEKVQIDFDWEHSIIKQIDSCSSIFDIESIDFFDPKNIINTAKVSV
jgi:hypothetical protein